MSFDAAKHSFKERKASKSNSSGHDPSMCKKQKCALHRDFDQRVASDRNEWMCPAERLELTFLSLVSLNASDGSRQEMVLERGLSIALWHYHGLEQR